jgi:ABC-type lipoprotein release transport system permease subunit
VVVAVLVFVLSVLLSFVAGIRASLSATGSSRNIIVIKPGATAESTSLLMQEDTNKLVQTPGVAVSPEHGLLISRELCVQTTLPRTAMGGSLANVAVRGVNPEAFAVHTELRLIEGRMMEQGQLELMTGKAAQDRYTNLRIGDEIALGRAGNRTFKVVGVFEAAKGALESEVWAPLTMLQDAYIRPFVSSAVLRMDESADLEEAIAYVNGSAVELEAKKETDYYRELSNKTREIVVLTTALVGIMGIGAAFAVANTMFAAVDGRRREIAMLRTMGFMKRAIVISFLVESMLICGLACIAGLLLSLTINGSRQDFLSDTTWTVLAYELKITPQIVLISMVTAMLVGLCGALVPALKAARTQVLDALRKA